MFEAYGSPMRRGGRRVVGVLGALDASLVAGLILLTGLSVVVLYSSGGESMSLVVKQFVRVLIAFLIMLAVARVPLPTLARWSPYVYVLGLGLLAMVLVFGIVGKGAQRWLDLGVFRFQPAEIMKLAVPMMVAWVLTRGGLPPRYSHLGLALAVVIVPTLMVAAQPDLGTALLIAVSGVFVIFLSGIRWRDIIVVLGLVAASAPVLWNVLHDYQRRRILTLFDPWQDPLGSGYHTIQSIIAVGSGGLAGKGWMRGSQSQLEFIPERSTDFVFAVFAEEFGFYGGLFLITIYVAVVMRCMVIAFSANGSFARMLGGSLALTFFIYVFVNIGMVTGVLPVVGVPLPLVSYGGTSMVTIMAAFGILMSINNTQRSLMK